MVAHPCFKHLLITYSCNYCPIFPGHINNLFNTVFWNLVQKGGLTTSQAEEKLRVNMFLFLVLQQTATGKCNVMAI